MAKAKRRKQTAERKAIARVDHYPRGHAALHRRTTSEVMRLDRWVNERNSFGTSKDPMTRTTFARDVIMNREILEALFRYDWLTRRAVEIPADDSTREWIDIKHKDPKRKQEIEREIDRLDLRFKFWELITLGRLYGGAVTVIGAWDGNDPSEPLNDKAIRDIRFIGTIDRYLAYPKTWYMDKMQPNYGNIETYLVTRPHVIGSDVAVVHESRIIRLDGNWLSPLERIKNFTYGASVVENIFEATRMFGVISQGLAGVVQDFVTKKLKVGNLRDLLQDAEGEAMLINRLAVLASGMSQYSIAAFGDDEEFDKMGTPITGLPDLADRAVEYASAATGIPRSRLFNNMSGRLGGDAGENDLKVHYDRIRSYQTTKLTAKLKRMLQVCLAPIGVKPDEIEFDWAPLWQMSDKEWADSYAQVAAADVSYIQNGVLEPEEVATSRFRGDGVNLRDINIVKEPREKFLKKFRTFEPRDPMAPTAEDVTGTGDDDDVEKTGNGDDKKQQGAGSPDEGATDLRGAGKGGNGKGNGADAR